MLRGPVAESRAVIEGIVALSHARDDPRHIAWVTGFLGAVYLSQGRDVEAAAALQQCVSNSRAINSRVTLAFALSWLGRRQVRSGELRAAAATIHESLRHQLTMQFGLMTLPALEATAFAAAWARGEQLTLLEAIACGMAVSAPVDA